MYIVKQGRLSVVNETCTVKFVTLNEGSVFGELSILDIPGNKNGKFMNFDFVACFPLNS